MTTIYIPTANWTTALINAIEIAQDGDEIIIHNDAMRELAERAITRMCPDKQVTLTVTSKPDRRV